MKELPSARRPGRGRRFDAINQAVALTAEQVRFIAVRRFGIGCDQILLVEKPQTPDAEFRYRIYNADGSEVEQCGNGARCFARFVHDKGLTRSKIPVETARGLIVLTLQDDGQVTVNLGVPRLDPVVIAGTVLVLLAIGVVAGMIPARTAASTDPIEALRK